MQSDLCPSACIVELPSKPHRGRSASVGAVANSLIVVLPRSSGMGFLPSSQMYSSLYFFIVFGCPVGRASHAQPGVSRTTQQLGRFDQFEKYRVNVGIVQFIKSIGSIRLFRAAAPPFACAGWLPESGILGLRDAVRQRLRWLRSSCSRSESSMRSRHFGR